MRAAPYRVASWRGQRTWRKLRAQLLRRHSVVVIESRLTLPRIGACARNKIKVDTC